MADDKRQVIELVSSLDNTGFQKAKKEISDITKEQAKQAGQAEKTGVSIGGITAALSGVIAAAYAGKKAFDFFAYSVNEFAKEQAVIVQLESTLRSTGKAAIFTSDELRAMASELQNFSTVSDDAIIQAQAIALRFEKLGRDEMPRLMKVAVDASVALGMDLSSAFTKLGRAIEDPIQGMSALTREGIIFDRQQQNLIRTLVESGRSFEAQEIILSRVEKAFAGSAQAEIATYAGQVKQLKNSFGDLQETIGSWLVPSLIKGVGLLKEFVDAAQYFSQGEKATNRYAEALDKAAELQKQFNTAYAQYQNFQKAGYSQAQDYLQIAAGIQKEWQEQKKLIAEIEKEMSLNVAKTAAKREQMIATDKANKAEVKAAEERARLAEDEKKQAEIVAKARYDVRVKGIDREMEYAKQMAEATTTQELDQVYYNIEKQIEMEQMRLDRVKAISEEENAFNAEQSALYLAQYQYLEEQKATISAQYAENQKNQLRSLNAVDKWLLTERAKNFQSTMQFISTLASSENSELAAIGKAAAITSATISTYEAANKALASAPPPFSFALAAATVAAGLANVATIAGIKLAKGGLVPGSMGGVSATIGEGGKTEAVLPLERPSTMRQIAQAITGQMAGGGATIYQTINLTPAVGLTMDEITQAVKDGTAQAQEMAKTVFKAGSALEGNA